MLNTTEHLLNSPEQVTWTVCTVAANVAICILGWWRCFANNYLHWAAGSTWLLLIAQGNGSSASRSLFCVPFPLYVSLFLPSLFLCFKPLRSFFHYFLVFFWVFFVRSYFLRFIFLSFFPSFSFLILSFVSFQPFRSFFNYSFAPFSFVLYFLPSPFASLVYLFHSLYLYFPLFICFSFLTLSFLSFQPFSSFLSFSSFSAFSFSFVAFFLTRFLC